MIAGFNFNASKVVHFVYAANTIVSLNEKDKSHYIEKGKIQTTVGWSESRKHSLFGGKLSPTITAYSWLYERRIWVSSLEHVSVYTNSCLRYNNNTNMLN